MTTQEILSLLCFEIEQIRDHFYQQIGGVPGYFRHIEVYSVSVTIHYDGPLSSLFAISSITVCNVFVLSMCGCHVVSLLGGQHVVKRAV